MVTHTLRIRVIPGARKDGIEKFGEILKIKVRCAPEKGKANAAVEALLAQFLGVPANCVCVIAGHTNPLKTIQVQQLSAAQIEAKINALPA